MGRPSWGSTPSTCSPATAASLFNKQIMKCCVKRHGGGLSSDLRLALFCRQSLHSAALGKTGNPSAFLGPSLPCGCVLQLVYLPSHPAVYLYLSLFPGRAQVPLRNGRTWLSPLP